MNLIGLDRMKVWLSTKGDVLYPGSRAVYSYVATVEKRGSLLDVGCCFGAGTAYLASRGFNVLGVDVDALSLQMARGLYPWLRWGLFDISSEPSYDVFDVVLAVESLEHMEDEASGVKNILAATTRRAYISTPNGGNGQSGNPQHTHELSINEMLSLVAACPNAKVTKILSVADFQVVLPGSKAGDLLYIIDKETDL